MRIRQEFLRALSVAALAVSFSACDDAGINVSDAAVGCGNGTIDSGEQCDDGNTIDGDGCSSACQLETPDAECGNATQEGTEECDDGNVVDGDGCSSTCTSETAVFCGNGTVDDGEECDDGNNVDGDGCDAACVTEAACGDGTVDDGEGCDDGNTDDGDGCSADCAVEAACGDGNVDDGETCDDGNTDDGDGCDASCQLEATCGDGNVDDGETCDDGNTDAGDGCDADCQLEAACGDGNVDDGETCDDGNTEAGDGCDADCQTEAVCGDSEVTGDEQCDDGNTDAGDGCDDACQFEPAVCGDGILQNTETCDDGNVAQADGCSPECLEEIPCIIIDDCDVGQICARGFCTDEEPPVVCGDGLIEGDEQCDDANAVPGDGCDENCQIEIPDPVCGNMVVELGELCDDGNLINGDGCNENCLVEGCGNGLLELGEECDDGNLDAGDLCDANCAIERVCGDENLTDDEQCDDGNVEPGDGCDADCNIEPECGNGMVEAGEECDDNNLDPDDGCSPECILDIVCGNGVRQEGEACDDGNILPLDGCDAACQVEDGFVFPLAPEGLCVQVGGAIDEQDPVWDRPAGFQACAPGDGNDHFYEVFTFTNAGVTPQFIDATAIWGGDGFLHIFSDPFDAANLDLENGCLAFDDDFNGTGGSQITDFEVAPGQTIVVVASTFGANAAIGPYGIDVCSVPAPARCGDGILQEDNGEECDDGNNDDDDGCSALCQRDPVCGDGFVDGLEECDDSNIEAGDGCDVDCQREPICGDTFLDDPEQCDDGNVDAGDGCDANCVFESECGNGIQEGLEQCEDGNLDAGDGCDADCVLEQPDALLIAERGLTIDIAGSLAEGDATWNRPSAGCGFPSPDRVYDFYRVTNDTGADQQLTITAAWGGDSYLHVFGDPFNPIDPAGCIIGNDDFNGVAGSRLLDVDIAAGQTLVIVASSFGANSFTGDYTIEVLTQHVCGDNLLGEGVEECDDGNLDNGDGCNDVCLIEAVCGDDVIGLGEECDDGNADAGDGCDDACQIERICGNDLLTDDEECDDGNLDNGDGCDDACVIEPACGDGDLDDGEECDDGNVDANDGCGPNCRIERRCGNGLLTDDEQCDDGNNMPGDGCSPVCELDGPFAIALPDGSINYGGEIDDADAQWARPNENCTPSVGIDHFFETQTIVNNTGVNQAVRVTANWGDDGFVHIFRMPFDPAVLDTCVIGDDDFINRLGSRVDTVDIADGEMLVIVASTFGANDAIGPYAVEVYTLPICGDGVVQGDETCDDENDDDFDGCSNACTIAPTCGDDVIEDPETCDDGNRDDGDGCDASCLIEEACGNGLIEDGEACDDGNTDNGDGCDDACQFEIFCGNGNLDEGETCDDGNADAGDGCDANCILEQTCGNGDVEGTEQCDDGNVDADDGCDAECAIEQPDALPIAPRGEAIDIEGSLDDTDLRWARPNEDCAPGNPGRFLDFYRVTNNTGADQQLRITGAWGGDSYLHVYTDPFDPAILDGCVIGDDDFNGLNGSQLTDIDIADGETIVIVASSFGANPTGAYSIEVFTQTVCGDAVVQGDEECEDGNLDNGDGCDENCQVEPACGDGEIDAFLNEECDDGNLDAGDGCDAACQREPVCGDTFVDDPEECDDGNLDAGDGCDANCVFESECGNGEREGLEQCDGGPNCAEDCTVVQPDALNIAPRNESIVLEGALEEGDLLWARLNAACGETGFEGRSVDFYRLTNNTGADQQLTALAAWGGDSFLYAFSDPFNPADAGNCIIGNDDFGGTAGSRLTNVAIADGETIVIVASSYNAGFTGAYTIDVLTQPVCGDGDLQGAETCDDGNLDAGDGCDANCELEPGCGNGQLDDGETCDDGNLDNGDGCDDACQFEIFCGNGNVDAGEQCDDGNVENGDRCDANCQFEQVCGDGVIEGTETCDDGNVAVADGCDDNCLIEEILAIAERGESISYAGDLDDQGPLWARPNADCSASNGVDHFYATQTIVNNTGVDQAVRITAAWSGDGFLHAYTMPFDAAALDTCVIGDDDFTAPPAAGRLGSRIETVNIPAGSMLVIVSSTFTANVATGPYTIEVFTLTVCGDGEVQGDETCDDQNDDDFDGCTNTCQLGAVCGDGVVDDSEACDDGLRLDGDGCDATCQFEIFCGNSNVDAGEQCDDGNADAGDGCDAACQREPICGDGFVDGDEECDDGNLDNGDLCSDACEFEQVCGNGELEGTEQCDDGNLANADGCDAVCTPEVIAFALAIEQRDNATANGESDDYTFTVDHTQSIVTITTTGCDDGDDTTLGLFPVNGDGTLGDRLAFNDDAGGGTCSQIVASLDAGDYLIRMRGFGGGAVTGYTLDYRLETDVTAGGAYNGDLAVGGTDLFVFDLAADGRVILETSDGAGGCGVDTQMNVYPIDVDGNRGAPVFDDDDGVGFCSLVDQDFIAGRYEVVLNDFQRNNAIAYVLSAQFPVCGNSVVEGDEACDDGNLDAGDGCDAACLIEPGCGNGQIDAGETCDDGNLINGDECNDQCQLENPPVEGDLRLIDGPSDNDGRLEVFANDTWGTVCDDNWDNEQAFINADVACQQLGFAGVAEVGNAAGGVDPILLDNVVCVGDEDRLIDCPANAIGVENCGHGEDIGLRCLVDGECRIDSQCADGQLCLDSACIANPCGNGAIDDGEECDDGNNVDGDGCTADCISEPRCGDGQIDLGEVCDDGNTDNGDGCDENCLIEIGCGNGVVELLEACDDGNLDNGDGCDDACQLEAVCGDGNVEGGEECDDGNLDNNDGCSAACETEFAIAPRDQAIELAGSIDDADAQWARPSAGCAGGGAGHFYETRVIYNDSGADQTVRLTAAWAAGDGYLHAYTVPFDPESTDNCIEGDDDFNNNGAGNAAGSRIGAVAIPAGTALVLVASTFDPNDAIGDYTIEVFTLPVCGDGELQGGEECDDGNAVDGDGCSAICVVEPVCGNGDLEAGEECDDGNLVNGDGCSDACINEILCGDGELEDGEECDDGNLDNGDGCDAECSNEFFNNNLAITQADSRMAAGSSDTFRFTLDATGRVLFFTSDGIFGCPADTTAALFAVNDDGTRGGQLGPDIDNGPNPFAPQCAGALLTDLPAGTYEIEIAEQADGAIPTYQVDLLVAVDAAVESSNQGVMPAGGTDGYFFTVDAADTELAIFTDIAPGDCADTDTVMQIFTISLQTGQLTPLVGNDDGGTPNCSLVQQVFQPGNYAVVINEFGNNAAIDAYNLNIECVSCRNAARPVPGDLVITEIMKDSDAVSDANGEWFEAINVSDRDIDLFGVIVRDDGVDSFTIAESVVVPAGGYAVFARNSDAAVNGGLDADLMYEGFFLSNGTDEVVLETWRGEEIDRVEYSDANFPDDRGVSAQFGGDIAADDNNDGALWCVSTSIYGAGDIGTPGAANDGCAVVGPAVFELSYAGFDISENPIEIVAGTTVRWTNLDGAGHDVVSGNPGDMDAGDLFRSARLAQGDVFEHTFNDVGDFTYFCSPHQAFMNNYVINVIAAP